MATTKIYNFNTISDYDYDNGLISLNPARLRLQQDDVDFTEDFADDTGFTYDSDKAEFAGGLVRQIDQRPDDLTFYASYGNNEDANYSNGSGVGTLVNGAAVLGGYLVLLGAGGEYCFYPTANNADFEQIITIAMEFETGYTGSPAGYRGFFSISAGTASLNSMIQVFHLPSGGITFQVYNSSGSAIFDVNLGTWAATAGIHNLEANIDITSGSSMFFMDGTQLGATQSATGTRDSSDYNTLFLGTSYDKSVACDIKINKFAVFDTIQHVTNYTPDWSNITETIYVENSVIIPEMEHTYTGSIKLFNSLTSIYVGSPRILLEIGRSGNKLYWNGSVWVTSDETYDQATDPVTFNTNCGSLPVNGEKYVQFTIVFPDSNTLSSFDELTANMNVDIGYSQTNPLLKLKTALNIDSILSLTMVYSEPGSDEIKMIAEVDSVDYYWDGSAWAVSSGYSESNSYTDFKNNISTLLSDSSGFKFGLYFHSDDGSTTPSATSLTLLYNYIDIIIGTNSWVLLDEANIYMDYRFNNSTWESSTEIDIKKAIITAFKWLYNSQKFNIPLTATSQIVKDAQIELANYILVNFVEFEKRRSLQAQGVENFKVLKWQEKFIKDADIPQFINDMLIDFVQNKGGKFFTVNRNLSGNRS